MPQGTVTLLLADIEGSTSAWESDPQAMTLGIAVHDRIVSESLARWNGVRPRDQGEGDAFVAGFARASDAVACALEIQSALNEPHEGTPIKLRIGIHTGEVLSRDEWNYMGTSINRAARIRNVGHGGQVLLSQSARDLVVDSLPERARLRDLGEHRLKNLSRAERIWQLEHPSIGVDFPPLTSLDSLPNNLPVQLTSFLGREQEISRLSEDLSANRLVTLTGTGGAGKTRLALQVGAEALESFPDGAWFVDLSPLSGDGAVRTAIAGELHLSADEVERLATAIGDRCMLLILDNCEHLVVECAHAADDLLRSCPNLKILATSRELLGVPGEVAWRVPSLGLPQAEDRDDPKAALEAEAVRLFVERAQRARPGFELTSADARAVVEICERVDGIPLAIELAAARTRVMSPEKIASGLNDRFKLLAGGARTLLPRQQTLRASVDWSYRLLDGDEAATLRRLAIFPGDFSLESAEAVCGGGDLEPYEVLDLVTRLVDKSLLLAEETDGDARYRMLETIRGYALEQLAEDPEAGEVTERFRARWAEWSDRPIDEWWGPDTLVLMEELHTEWPSIEAAVEGALADGDLATASRIAMGLAPAVGITGRSKIGTDWLDRISPQLEADPRLGQVLVSAALCSATGSAWGEVARYVHRGMPLLDDDMGYWKSIAMYLRTAASLIDADGAAELQRAEEAIAFVAAYGDEMLHGLVLGSGAWILLNADEVERALDQLDQARELVRRGGYVMSQAMLAFWGGMMRARTARYEEARPDYEEALPVFEKLPYRLWTQWALDHLSSVCLAAGDLEAARHYAERGLRLSEEAGLRSGNYPFLMQNLSGLSERLGDFDAMRRWAVAARDFYSERPDQYQTPSYELAAAALAALASERAGDVRAGLSEAIDVLRRARYVQPQVMTSSGTEVRPPLAAPLSALARAAARTGDAVRAARLDGATRRLWTDNPPWDGRIAWHDEVLEPARRALGDRWEQESDVGAGMETDDVVAYALETIEIPGPTT